MNYEGFLNHTLRVWPWASCLVFINFHLLFSKGLVFSRFVVRVNWCNPPSRVPGTWFLNTPYVLIFDHYLVYLFWENENSTSFFICSILVFHFLIHVSEFEQTTIIFLNNFHLFSSVQSPLLVLLVVMLPKARLTSHSRMSGSRWVITPLWLSGSWRSFLYSSSVYSCHLFLISSASVRSVPFLSFIEPIFAWNAPLVSLNFLEEISSLSHSVVFLYFFALIAEEGFLTSPGYSLELCIQMGISFLFSFAFCFLL